MKAPGYQPKLDLNDWQTINKQEYEHIFSLIAPELHSYIEEHAAMSQLMDQVRLGYNEEIYQIALDEIETELTQHFAYEEAYILPRLRKYFATDEAGPIMKLLQEHQTIRKNFADAAFLFAQRKPEAAVQALVQKMNLLAYLLKKHIEKEDHYFFPMVSLILNQAEKEEIAAEVKAAYELRGK